jgi:hypothetical protein
MVRADIFTGSLAVFEESGEPACGRAAKSGWLFFAAFGGEIRSNYFQYRAHFRESQSFRLAASRLGGQIERRFPAKNLIFDFIVGETGSKRKFLSKI